MWGKYIEFFFNITYWVHDIDIMNFRLMISIIGIIGYNYYKHASATKKHIE